MNGFVSAAGGMGGISSSQPVTPSLVQSELMPHTNNLSELSEKLAALSTQQQRETTVEDEVSEEKKGREREGMDYRMMNRKGTREV